MGRWAYKTTVDCGTAPEVNPCDPDPEMVLTVTGAAGNINWCGQTWNLPGDSGVEKSACPTPTHYVKSRKSGTTTGYKYYHARHRWLYWNGAQASLRLTFSYHIGSYGNPAIFYRGTTFGGDGDIAFVEMRANGAQHRDYKDFTNSAGAPRPVPPTAAPLAPNDLNLLTAQGPAFWDTYTLTNNFFGSHTVAGITYAWAKGAGWP